MVCFRSGLGQAFWQSPWLGGRLAGVLAMGSKGCGGFSSLGASPSKPRLGASSSCSCSLAVTTGERAAKQGVGPVLTCSPWALPVPLTRLGV